jgi:hypothetical protein
MYDDVNWCLSLTSLYPKHSFAYPLILICISEGSFHCTAKGVIVFVVYMTKYRQIIGDVVNVF